MIPRHLVQLAPTLFATQAAWYGKKNHFVRKIHSRILRDVERVNAELGLKDHMFVLRPIPGAAFGLTFPTIKTAYIDARRKSYREVLSTLLHEGLHLQQVQHGRLKWSSVKFSLVWDGKSHHNVAEYKSELTEETLMQYRALPWETDVTSRHDNLYRKLFKKNPPMLNDKVRR